MPSIRSLVFAFLALLFTGCAAEPAVTFIVTPATPLSDSAAVYLTGDGESFGSWQPDAVPLQQQGDGRWTTTLSVKPGPLVFKITRGTWETEAVSAEGVVPANYRFTIRTDTTISLTVDNWKDVIHKIEGQITGTVAYHRALTGRGLKPRDVIVWLPPSYAGAPEQRYPVLYMHDGQNIVDPNTSYTKVDWQVDEAVDSLSRQGRMPEIIIVGVYNTPDRSTEYNDTDLGRAYLRFLVDDLKPMIDTTYRTLPDRANTAVMGSSMGGLISFLAAWEHPEVFSKAACLSPYFPEDLPQKVQSRAWDTANLRLYLDNGGDELDTQLQEGTDAMLKVLPARGFTEGDNLMWVRDPAAAHNERAWATRIWRPLLFMFGT